MDGITIHVIFMGLVCLFTGITFFRMYLRTGLKGHLLIAIGVITALIGGIGIFINYRIGYEGMVNVLGQILIIPGIIVAVSGLILIYTIESVSARNAYSGHSILDIMFGNISSLENKKYIPKLTRSGGIVGGALLIVFGIVKCWHQYLSKSYIGIIAIAFGLAIFVISILALKEIK